MPVIRAHCPDCDRAFYVADDPSLDASYRCPVCLTMGRQTSLTADDGGEGDRD